MDKQLDTVALTKIKLKILFRAAYHGRITLDYLYEKGSKIINGLEHSVKDSHMPEEITEASTFIEELHDSSTRRYNEQNREVLYYHLRRLG